MAAIGRVAPARSALVVALTFVFAAVLLLLSATPASAHTTLTGVTPAKGATVATAPTQVSLTFSGPVRAPSVIVVTDPRGARVQRGAVHIRGNAVTAQIAAAAPGRYTVAFRVVAADGHAVTGQTMFVYRPVAPTTSASPPPKSADATVAATTPATHHERGSSESEWFFGGVAGLTMLSGIVLIWVRRRQIDASPDQAGQDS